jgi:hypothetical protein
MCFQLQFTKSPIAAYEKISFPNIESYLLRKSQSVGILHSNNSISQLWTSFYDLFVHKLLDSVPFTTYLYVVCRIKFKIKSLYNYIIETNIAYKHHKRKRGYWKAIFWALPGNHLKIVSFWNIWETPSQPNE